MKSWLVFPSSPTGNSRRIELSGYDLRAGRPMSYIFVYPSDLNIDRFNDALGRTLSLWPFVAGRFFLADDDHYVIEMSDNGIPISLVENTDLSRWSLDSNVVPDAAVDQHTAFLDIVQDEKIVRNSSDKSLFCLKITHLIQSGEWVMGTSWSHILGDACTCVNFLHTLSRFYQQLEPLEPPPLFERRLWRKDEADQSLLPTMKLLSDSVSTKDYGVYMNAQPVYALLNLHFSGKQLVDLRKLVLDDTVTKHDVMIAYVILTLNTHCFTNDEQRILRTDTDINFRGISDSIAPSNQVGNCTLRMLSCNFDDPWSLSSIAKSLRHSIINARNPQFVERYVATADGLLRDMARDDRKPNGKQFANEIVLNSCFRYDWASLVDFGHTDKCRFYSHRTRYLFVQAFRLNPIYDHTEWAKRDHEGAEVAFRIEQTDKKKFIDAWQRDVNEKFINVKR